MGIARTTDGSDMWRARVCVREKDYNIIHIIIIYIYVRFAIDFGRQIQFLEPDPFPKISRVCVCVYLEEENYSWTARFSDGL